LPTEKPKKYYDLLKALQVDFHCTQNLGAAGGQFIVHYSLPDINHFNILVLATFDSVTVHFMQYPNLIATQYSLSMQKMWQTSSFVSSISEINYVVMKKSLRHMEYIHQED